MIMYMTFFRNTVLAGGFSLMVLVGPIGSTVVTDGRADQTAAVLDQTGMGHRIN